MAAALLGSGSSQEIAIAAVHQSVGKPQQSLHPKTQVIGAAGPILFDNRRAEQQSRDLPVTGPGPRRVKGLQRPQPTGGATFGGIETGPKATVGNHIGKSSNALHPRGQQSRRQHDLSGKAGGFYRLQTLNVQLEKSAIFGEEDVQFACPAAVNGHTTLQPVQ